MKKIIFSMLLLLLLVSLSATNVNVSSAQNVATNWIATNAPITNNYKIAKTISYRSCYILKLLPTGFIVMPKTDVLSPILGYSFSNSFNEKDIPPALEGIFKSYELAAKENTTRNKLWDKFNQPLRDRTLVSKVDPLLSTTWGQGWPYNDLCPIDTTTNHQSIVGCVATAWSQIMKYWEYPTVGIGDNGYKPPKCDSIYVNFANTTYDWENMPNYLPGSSTDTTAINATATLCYHAGVAVNMDYGSSLSGAFMDSADLKDHFNYYIDSHFSNLYAIDNCIGKHQYENIFMAELEASRPMDFSGINSSYTMGHSYVVDGYSIDDTTSNVLFHINYGWNGACDGYYEVMAPSWLYGNLGAIFYKVQPDSNHVIINPSKIRCNQRETISFSIETDGNPTAISWDFGDGTTSNLTNPTHHFATSGDHIVKANVTFAGQYTRKGAVYIDVRPNSYVFQDITEDITWDCDTMYVMTDITIENSATLTIDPGVNVLFVDPLRSAYNRCFHSITVNGVLNINGAEDDNVIFTVEDTTYFSNTQSKNGAWGGIYFDNTNSPSHINYTHFEYIKAFNDGSSEHRVITLDHSDNVTIENSDFQNIGEWYEGLTPILNGCAVGILNSNNITIKNSIISNNDLSHNFYTVYSNASSVDFFNNIITDNNIAYCPSLTADYHSNVNVYNNIFWNNTATYNYSVVSLNSSTVNFANNLVQNGYNGLWGLGINTEEEFSNTGSIASDPLFISSSNYHLSINSPCIDAGNPTSPLDPDGTRADIGSFFFDQQELIPSDVTLSKELPNMNLSWQNSNSNVSKNYIYKGTDFGNYTLIDSISNGTSIVLPIGSDTMALYYVTSIVDRDSLSSLVSDKSKLVGFVNYPYTTYHSNLTNLSVISLPFVSYDYKNASDLGKDNDYNIDAISYWDVPGQAWITTCPGPFGWIGDYSLKHADSYMISLTAEDSIYIYGDMVKEKSFNLFHDDSLSLRNFIYLPLEKSSITSASELKDDLSSAVKIEKWNMETQKWAVFEKINGTWSGTNFSISPLDPLMVSVNQGTVWPRYFKGASPATEPTENIDELPLAYTLYDNYPNPFNPETTISFSISHESNVNINLYNLKGQKVKTIANGKYKEGIHKIVWDGTNSNKKAVASGVYFYKFSINGNTKLIKKCLLLK